MSAESMPLLPAFSQFVYRLEGRSQSSTDTFWQHPIKVEKARDLYPFYLKIWECVVKPDVDKQYLSTEIAKIQGNRVSRVGAPPVTLDFSPIREALKQPTVSLPLYDFEEVDLDRPEKVGEAARAIDALANEGTGRSFGVSVYRKILSSDSAYCVVARPQQEDRIVGCMLGTCTKVNEITIFHIWLMAREGNRPKMRLIEKCLSYESQITQKFQPDLLSLSVDQSNHAKTLYAKHDFKVVDSEVSSHTGEMADLMVKEIKEGTKVPSLQEVTQAITKQSLEILGIRGFYYMLLYKVQMMAYKLWYK